MALRGAAANAITAIVRRRNQVLSSSLRFHHFPSDSLRSSTICHCRQTGFKNQIRTVQNATTDSVISRKERYDEEESPENWRIKMLYDGDCPLCMREVDMLKARNKQYGTIKFVDISSDEYSPEENQGLDYETVMGRIHAIQSNGTVVKDVEAFRRLYEEVGLGWVYAITKYEPIATIADAVYGVWAKYRLQITGRPPLEEVLEARRKNKGKTCRDDDACNM